MPDDPFCPDGTAAVNGECFKTCPDGSRILEGQACPELTKTCPDGTVIPVYQACPAQTKTCPDGTVIPAYQACPAQTQTCPDGTVIPIYQACPAQTKTCPDGSVIPVYQACPAQTKTCSDGSVIPATAACAEPPPPMQTCWDGTVIPVTAVCAPPPPVEETCAEIDVPRSRQGASYNGCYSNGLYFNERMIKAETGKSCIKFYYQRVGGPRVYYDLPYYPGSCVTVRGRGDPGNQDSGFYYDFDTVIDNPTDGIRAALLQRAYGGYHGDPVQYQSLEFSYAPGGFFTQRFCYESFYFSQGNYGNCSGGN
ncbi:MAG: hypothetical protein PHX60_07195 [Giesbergeria sp.]|uniref:hypothetical protein n=1 Tax=Giesbergeria sp. TaxID=2818473 RepID=UPI00260D971F|nr:hypothetical protein [Giesbergeria sp.]MDD2609472.1 hypothetical protein [Giesbergeria sp.]